MSVIDLHTHSSVSDGTQTPAELIAAAVAAGIDVVALTDHDSTAGWDEAFEAARGTPITVVPGLELSTQIAGTSVHILGYLVDPAEPGLVEGTALIRAERLSRAESMVGRIGRDYHLTWDDVLAQTTPGATVGRPHIADALVARGHVADRMEAFSGILHWKGGYYRSHPAPTPLEGVELIVGAGGVPVIAHPGGRGPDRILHNGVFEKLVDAGLFGLEVRHRDNSPADQVKWAEVARRFGLVETGSSDFHGLGKPNVLAENTTTPEAYAAIVAAATGAVPFTEPG
ncbi:MAG TPA: PHP domain-containing protein [Pseudolysinimonas sp.]|nr:PHP domain-containing protein [Pseudolysinimonas sp.]